MRNIKQINVENRTYHFFNDMVNTKDFDSSLLKNERKSYRNIGIYNIGYIKVKKSDDYENIYSVIPLHLIIGKTIGHIEKNNGKKYLVFGSTNRWKQRSIKKLWDVIKNKIKIINDDECNSVERSSTECNSIECKYGKDFAKIQIWHRWSCH